MRISSDVFLYSFFVFLNWQYGFEFNRVEMMTINRMQKKKERIRRKLNNLSFELKLLS